MNIIDFIPYGKENAITRQKLCEITGLPDRKVRELIEKARHEGYIIINNQDGKGYYQTNDPKDIEAQYRQARKRALTILHYTKFLRQKLQQAGRAV